MSWNAGVPASSVGPWSLSAAPAFAFSERQSNANPVELQAMGGPEGRGVVGAAGESNDWHYDAPDCQALPNPLSRVRLGLCTQQCRQRPPPQARSGWSAKEGPTEPGRTTGEWGEGGMTEWHPGRGLTSTEDCRTLVAWWVLEGCPRGLQGGH